MNDVPSTKAADLTQLRETLQELLTRYTGLQIRTALDDMVVGPHDLIDSLRRMQANKEASEAFHRAWELWPLPGRRRSAKAKAMSKFMLLARKQTPERLLMAVREYLATPDAQKEGGAYVPALDRWLANGRWEVFLDPTTKSRPVGFV